MSVREIGSPWRLLKGLKQGFGEQAKRHGLEVISRECSVWWSPLEGSLEDTAVVWGVGSGSEMSEDPTKTRTCRS